VGGEREEELSKNSERGYLICSALMIIHYPVLQTQVHMSYTGKINQFDRVYNKSSRLYY